MHRDSPPEPHAERALAAAGHDALIEQTWRDLGGEIPRERIREIAVEVSARFADARVTAFLPILVQRFIRERLTEEARKGRATG